MRRSWLRRNRLITTLPVLSTRSGGLFSAMEKSASVADASVTTHFLGEASERRPWAFNRDDRPAIVAGRSELSLRVPRDTGRAYTSRYPIPLPAGTRFRHVKQRGKSAGNYHENVRGKDCGSLHHCARGLAKQFSRISPTATVSRTSAHGAMTSVQGSSS